MHCQLRSADRTYFDGDASMIVARSPRGEFAVMEAHAPLLAVLDRGTIRIQTDGGARVFVCEPGTLRTVGDRITLLVELAVPLEEIELSDVKAQMSQLDASSEEESAEEREHLMLLQDVKERYG